MSRLVLLLLIPVSGCLSPAGEPLADGVSAMEQAAFDAFAPEPLAGHGKSLMDLRGNVTLVFIWASWCSVCKADEPMLEEVHASYAEQGFEVMAVSHEQSRAAARDYAVEQDWAFASYWDSSAPQQLGLRNYQPSYLLFDRDGVPTWSEEQGLGSKGFERLRGEIEAVL